MSSIQSSFSQNRSRSFVVLTTGKFVSDSVLATLLTPASSVGSVSTFPTNATFFTFSGLSGSSPLVVSETLLDLGNEVNVGVSGIDSTLLKLRRVKRTTGGDVVTGYVVVENDVSKYAATVVSANALVGVART